MIDCHRELINALREILPTYYEMTLHSGIQTPCISYMETSNVAANEGDTLGYSRIRYQIKVWDTDISIVQEYSKQIDTKLRFMGFKRISANELYDQNSSMIQKIMSYECLALEDY